MSASARGLVLVALLAAAAPASSAGATGQDGLASAAGRAIAAHRSVRGMRSHVKSVKLILPVPAPNRARSFVKVIRLHRRLGAREWRRRAARGFQISMRVRRTDGVWSPRLRPGRRTELTDAHGNVLVQLIYWAQYKPRAGALRYAVAMRNSGVPASIYRRSRVTVRLTARYRF